jgi:hypothetical protein
MGKGVVDSGGRRGTVKGIVRMGGGWDGRERTGYGRSLRGKGGNWGGGWGGRERERRCGGSRKKVGIGMVEIVEEGEGNRGGEGGGD